MDRYRFRTPLMLAAYIVVVALLQGSTICASTMLSAGIVYPSSSKLAADWSIGYSFSGEKSVYTRGLEGVNAMFEFSTLPADNSSVGARTYLTVAALGQIFPISLTSSSSMVFRVGVGQSLITYDLNFRPENISRSSYFLMVGVRALLMGNSRINPGIVAVVRAYPNTLGDTETTWITKLSIQF